MFAKKITKALLLVISTSCVSSYAFAQHWRGGDQQPPNATNPNFPPQEGQTIPLTLPPSHLPQQPQIPQPPQAPQQPQAPQPPQNNGGWNNDNRGGRNDRDDDRNHWDNGRDNRGDWNNGRDDRGGRGGGWGPGRPGHGGGWGRPPMPPPPPPWRPDPRPRPPMPPPSQGSWQYDTQSIFVGRPVLNESFYIRENANLDGRYRGWEIVSVTARTVSNSPARTTVQLIADGRVIATQVNPGQLINLVPTSSAVLDRNVNSLQLVISGSTVIVDNINIQVRAYRQ